MAPPSTTSPCRSCSSTPSPTARRFASSSSSCRPRKRPDPLRGPARAGAQMRAPAGEALLERLVLVLVGIARTQLVGGLRVCAPVVSETQRRLEASTISRLIAAEVAAGGRVLRRFGITEPEPPLLTGGVDRLGARVAQQRPTARGLLLALGDRDDDCLPTAQRVLVDEHLVARQSLAQVPVERG